MAKLKKLTLALTLFVAGCGEPLPINLAGVEGELLPGDEDLVTEAVGILGMTWEETDLRRGTIHLALVGYGGNTNNGTALVRAPCVRAVVASRDAVVIAHEIAHALRLEHTCEDCVGSETDNLMAGSGNTGVDLTDEQIDQLEKGRRRITACR